MQHKDRLCLAIILNLTKCDITNRILEENFEGQINTSKYANMTKCSNLKDIQDLLKRSVFVQNTSVGQSTSYSLIDHVDD